MTGYVRASSGLIASGLTVLASNHENEFVALATAFGTGGHNHDGTATNGPKLSLTASVSGTLPVANGGTASTSAADARTALGLAVGTDVQAYDAGLLSIAGLTTAADKMIYTTALDTYAVTALTSAGRALLDDANAAAQRTTLGLGTIATQASNSVSISGGSITGITDLAIADGGTAASTAADARTNLAVPGVDTVNTYTKTQTAEEASVTSSGNSIAWDAADKQVIAHTATEDTTLANPSNLVAGSTFVFTFTQHASSAKTLGFGSAYKWPGGTAPTVSTGASAVDVFSFVTDGTNMYGTMQKDFS